MSTALGVLLAAASAPAPPVPAAASAAWAQDSLAVGPQAPPPPMRLHGVGVGLPAPGARAHRGGTSASTAGEGARALLSNVAGAPTSWVPGLAGVAFQPGTGITHFDRVYAHPTGHWVMTALADLPSGSDECLIFNGQLAIQEGAAAPWTGGAENCGTIDQRCAVNAAGDIAFATNSSGSTNDDYIATRINGVWGYAAREGDLVPGLPGATLDDAIDSAVLLDDGRAGYAADGIDGVASSGLDDVLVLGSHVLMQEGVSFPGAQAGPQAAIENFDLGDYWASGDGSTWVVQGDLDGATGRDDVVIVGGSVVLQEGQPIPGATFSEPIDNAGIFGVSMSAAGDWFARGDLDGSNRDWVVQNGAVIALGDTPVVPGSTELWDDTLFARGFFGHAGNGFGSHVVGGTTDHVDPSLDAVLVLDGSLVVARESDPVDLDGNGVLDDGVFIDAFGDDDLALLDDYRVLAVITLKDSSGARIGQALVEFDAGGDLGTAYCDSVPNSTGMHGRLAVAGSSPAGAGGLTFLAADLPPGESAILLVGTARAAVPLFAGDEGTFCLGGAIGLYDGPSQITKVDSTGRTSFAVDPAAIPNGAGGIIAGMSGDVWNFQCWHRDRRTDGSLTTNFTAAMEVVLR